MENRCTCDVGNVNVHRSFYAKCLRSKKHLENERISPEWTFEEEEQEEQTPFKKNLKNLHS